MGQSAIRTRKRWSKNRHRATDTQDDPANTTDTYGRFFNFRHPGTPPTDGDLNKNTVSPNMTMDEATPHILAHTPSAFQRMMESNYSTGFESDPAVLKENGGDHRKASSVSAQRIFAELMRQWTNPLEVQCVLSLK